MIKLTEKRLLKDSYKAELTGGQPTTLHSHSGGSDGETSVRLNADVPNSATSFIDVAGLSFIPEINKDYLIEMYVMYTTSGTTVGINLAVNGPAGFVALVGQLLGCTAVATLTGREFNAYNTSGGTLTAAIAGNNNIAVLQILFRNGANATSFVLRVAAETTGTVTVKIGSVLRYRKLN